MKRINLKEAIRLLAMTVLISGAFVACSDNDNDEPKLPENTVAEQGVFVFNGGNQSKAVEGSLSFIDLKNDKVLNDAFKTINGRSLGMTVQDGVVLGNNLYIAVSESNTIEVVNKNTLESVKQIQPTEAQGTSPRDIVSDGKYVYVSMYSGHVSRIDPATNTIDKTVAVGPNPEEMAIANGYLYVVNSDGMNYNNGYANGKSVSKINMSSMTEEKKIEVAVNPTRIGADNAGNVLLLCMGNYYDIPATIWKIDSKDNATDTGIAATIMTVSGNSLYVINAPWGATEVTYTKYNTRSITRTTAAQTSYNFVSQPVDSPAGITVDPDNGNIYITSYNMVGGYASYSTPGYVAEYSSDGTFVKKYDVGTGAVSMMIMK